MIIPNHIIMRSRNKEVAARFLGDLLEVSVSGPAGPFMHVEINQDFSIEFDDRGTFVEGHCAFLVDDDLFDRVLRNIKRAETRLVARRNLAGIARSGSPMITGALSMPAIPTATPMSFLHPRIRVLAVLWIATCADIASLLDLPSLPRL